MLSYFVALLIHLISMPSFRDGHAPHDEAVHVKSSGPLEMQYLTGRIVDRSGNPLLGAAVWAWQEDALDWKTQSGENGRFRVAVADPNVPVNICVLQPGYAQLSAQVDDVRDLTLVMEGGASVKGSVSRFDGSTVPRAQVVAVSSGDVALWIQTTTDEKGRFQMVNVPSGTYGFYVFNPRFKITRAHMKQLPFTVFAVTDGYEVSGLELYLRPDDANLPTRDASP